MKPVPENPSALLWRRLKKNFSAMAGLVVIILAFFISVFCYLFIPDNTPDANEMNLLLSTLKPGTSVKFIAMPPRIEPVVQPWYKTAFTGKFPEVRNVPVDSLWLNKDSVYYYEYGTMNEFKGEPLRESLSFILPSKGRDELPQSFLDEKVFTRTFILGTDRFGRDLLSRILAGTRISMSVGLIAVIISLAIGITLGALAGFFRGKVDEFIMWLINVIWSIPTLLLVIAITLALGKGYAQVFIAVGLTMWVEVARVVRGQIFSLREKEFVEAGRALGYKNSRIIIRHIVPNVISPVVVIAASNFASAILLEAGLSFLGMGAQPPTPSWGMMIKENYAYIIVDAAYLAVYPGLAIMIMVLAFTWLGNGLRDALDSKENTGSII